MEGRRDASPTSCTFIAATRPGYDLDAARRSHESAATRFRIEYIEVPALAISSTDMRRESPSSARSATSRPSRSSPTSRSTGSTGRWASIVAPVSFDEALSAVRERLGERGAAHCARVADTAARARRRSTASTSRPLGSRACCTTGTAIAPTSELRRRCAQLTASSSPRLTRSVPYLLHARTGAAGVSRGVSRAARRGRPGGRAPHRRRAGHDRRSTRSSTSPT